MSDVLDILGNSFAYAGIVVAACAALLVILALIALFLDLPSPFGMDFPEDDDETEHPSFCLCGKCFWKYLP